MIRLDETQMTWKSPGMTHMWCPKCKQQYATDVELLLRNGKIVYKWKCKVCGSENFSED